MWKRAAALGTLVLAAWLAPAGLHAYWFPDGRLTVDPATSMTSPNGGRCIAGDDSGFVHIVWRDNRSGDWEIYYKRYDGTVWGPDVRLTASPGFSGNPAIAAGEGGTLHVVWDDYRDGNSEIYYKRYDGAVWSADERLTNAAGNSQNPSVAVRGGIIHVVWHDFRDGDFEIYYKRHDGAAWSADERLTNAAGVSMFASVAAADAGRVYVVWSDYRDGNSEIYFKQHDGVSWSADERLTDASGTSQYPCVCAGSGGDVHVVWEDTRDGNSEIYYKTLTGGTWGADERLTSAAGQSQRPSIASLGSSQVHLAWSDDRDGNKEIYYKLRYGAAWGTSQRLTDASGLSQNVSVAMDESLAVHLVWYDGRDGNSEIYWKRSGSGEVLPPPLITSVDPDSGLSGHLVHLDAVAGHGFAAPADVRLQRPGEPDFIADNVIVSSPESIACDIDLLGAPEGLWDVVVENPDSKRDTLEDGFRILRPPRPRLTSIDPDSGAWNADAHIDSLAGTGFLRQIHVWMTHSGGDSLAATNIALLSPEWITCDFNLEGVGLGFWDVMVENIDGQRDTLESGFYVVPFPAPVIYAIDPDSGRQGFLEHIDDLSGTGFRPPLWVWLQRDGEEDVPGINKWVSYDRTCVTCDFDLAGVADGPWDVVIEIEDGQRDTLGQGYRVIPGPRIFSIAPDTALWGSTPHIDAVAGANYIDPMALRLVKSGEDNVVATNVVVESPESLTCDIALGLAPTGYWNVVVENSLGQTDTLVDGFSITPGPAPEVLGIVPDSGYAWFTAHIDSLTGSEFHAGAEVRLRKSPYADIKATGVVVHSADLISCEFNLDGVALGPRDVEVKNPDGETGTLVDGFLVGAAPAPVVSSIAPDNGIVGEVLGTVITGAGFYLTSRVRLRKEGESEICASNVVAAPPESIACEFDLSEAVSGLWNVVVVNEDGQAGSLQDGFAILATPRVDLVDPESWVAGGVVHITNLSGFNFFEPVNVWLARDGHPDVPAGNVVVESSRLVSMDVDLSGASPGPWDLVLESVGVERDTLSDGFTVLPFSMWFPGVAITTGAGEEVLSPVSARSIAAGAAGRAYVVWEDDRHGNAEIYLREFNGSTWESEQRVTDELGTSSAPAVAVDAAGNVHVVWVYLGGGGWHIYHDMYDGVAWAGHEDLSGTIGGEPACAVAADGAGNVHVVWLDVLTFAWDVFCRTYDGSSWHDEERVSNYWSSKAQPTVACDDSGHIHVAWYDHVDGSQYDSEIHYARKDAAGWSAAERISYGADVSWTPCIAGGPGTEAHLVWTDRRSGYFDVFYRHFDGALWGPEMRVTDWEPESVNASVGVDGNGRVHVVWRDRRAGSEEIYHTVLEGAAWTPTYRLSTPDFFLRESRNPSVAIGPDGKLHVAWQDRTGGSWDIYYRAGYPGALAGIVDLPEDAPPDRLLSITPNPVFGNTEIKLLGSGEGIHALSIYDIEGRLVWSAGPDEPASAGRGVRWRCCDMAGRRVSPGIYFARVRSGKRAATAKVVVLE